MSRADVDGLFAEDATSPCIGTSIGPWCKRETTHAEGQWQVVPIIIIRRGDVNRCWLRPKVRGSTPFIAGTKSKDAKICFNGRKGGFSSDVRNSENDIKGLIDDLPSVIVDFVSAGRIIGCFSTQKVQARRVEKRQENHQK